MKVSLVVATAGKSKGQAISIARSPFLIGRDAQCHLRPASALVSKRHCAIQVRDGKVFVRDFDSTNGTFIGDQPVKGEVELHHQDHLRIGTLDFEVHIQKSTTVTKPAAKAPAKSSDDEAAAMLLMMGDETPADGSESVDKDGIATGDTVYQAPTVAAPPPEATSPATSQPAAKKTEPAKPSAGDSSAAARAILDKYRRRPKS